jgi:hypothetical protein
MAGMADNDNLESLAAVSLGLEMDLGHQRTGGIDDFQISLFRLFHDCRGYTMGTEDGYRTGRGLVELFDKYGSLVFQIFDDMVIMDYLVQHVNGCAVSFEGTLHNLDCANHPCTESTGLSEYHLHGLILI